MDSENAMDSQCQTWSVLILLATITLICFTAIILIGAKMKRKWCFAVAVNNNDDIYEEIKESHNPNRPVSNMKPCHIMVPGPRDSGYIEPVIIQNPEFDTSKSTENGPKFQLNDNSPSNKTIQEKRNYITESNFYAERPTSYLNMSGVKTAPIIEQQYLNCINEEPTYVNKEDAVAVQSIYEQIS